MNPRRLPLAALGLLLVLHQDVWNWRQLAWIGALPVGFAYHLAFCAVVSVLMASLLHIDRRPEG